MSSSFYFDDNENDDESESYAVAGQVGNTASPFIPGSPPDPAEQYAYHQQMFSKQYQEVGPPTNIPDQNPLGNAIVASRNFQVSLVGDEGPDEWLAVSRAADNLTSIFDDTRDARYELENRYFAGGNYRPINFGIPNYTGDAGYPITDQNPGSCKPGFLKDQFGRCISITWFNLPHAPAGSPWTNASGASTIVNGMNSINGVCPPNMFLASNNRCYMHPDPPSTLPPPPPPPPATSGTTSGSSAYAASYYVQQPRSPTGRIYNMPRTIQAYNASVMGYTSPDVNSLDITTGNCRISQVYVDSQRVEPGDRVTINTSVILFKNNYRVRISIPNINFTTITPIIPVAFPGVTETIETDFIVPEDVQPDVYQGTVELIRENKVMDRQALAFDVG